MASTSLPERLRVAVRDWLMKNGESAHNPGHADPPSDARRADGTRSAGTADDPYAESSSPTANDRSAVEALNELASGLSITCIYLDKESKVIEFAAPWAKPDSDPDAIEFVAREIAKRILETDVPDIVRVRPHYRLVALK